MERDRRLTGTRRGQRVRDALRQHNSPCVLMRWRRWNRLRRPSSPQIEECPPARFVVQLNKDQKIALPPTLSLMNTQQVRLQVLPLFN